MKTVTITQKLAEEILDQLEGAQKDCYVQSTEIVINDLKKALYMPDVSVLVLSDEEMREPIENALYATRRFLTTQATDLAEGIVQYIKEAEYTIVRTKR